LTQPPAWTQAQLAEACLRSAEHFREGRGTEPLEAYLELFDEYRGVVEEVLEETVDLTMLADVALSILSDKRKREVFRYLSGPPVSEDDLRTLMQAQSIAPNRLRDDPELLTRIVAFMRDWHDRRRFPWVGNGHEASERERGAAILATTALLAMRRLETVRRNEGKGLQEHMVAVQLRRSNFVEVPTRRIMTLNNAPRAGEFCPESMLGARKADFVIGLFVGRTMALECKVSNSEVNSIKRVNNDAAVKAEVWLTDFGTLQVVPAAVLGGVFNPRHLEDAQRRGLALFWAHDLQALTAWLHQPQ